MSQDPDRLLTATSLLGILALVSWIVYIQVDAPRLWLALAVVSTIACCTATLLASLREMEARLSRGFVRSPGTER